MSNLRGFARKRVANKAEYYFPDEILTNILSRLPAKDVLHCRCVCRRWRDLTSDRNQDFLDLHLKFCVPMILAVDDRITRGDDPFLLDKWWETGRKRSVIHRFATEYCIRYSVNGLIVSEQIVPDEVGCSGNFIIFNPMNGENVRIPLSKEIRSSDLHGVYFHPLLNKYCTLWRVSPKSWYDLENAEYMVLNLESNPSCWHKIRNPSNKNPMICSLEPVFIDKYLYWIVEAEQDDNYYNPSLNTIVTINLDIIEFDIITEEFKMMPCPVPGVFKGYKCNINLLIIEGCLSLIRMSRGTKSVVDINIWTLKDRIQPLWECSDYRVNLDLHPSKFHLKAGVLKAICAANGKLAIQSHRTLFIYDLKGGNIWIMGKKKHTHDVLFFSHLMTFASLRNCKSNISMNECGEVDIEEKNSLVFKSKQERRALKSSVNNESDNEESSSSTSSSDRKGIVDACVGTERRSSSDILDTLKSDNEEKLSSDK